jgi:5-(carboxyamino)imidazole ribonucleotide mutase
VALLANENPDLRMELDAFRIDQTELARKSVLPITGSAV